MTDHKLPDEMAILLIHAATRSDGLCYPFPIIKRAQEKGMPQRTRAELDKAAEGLLRRGYLKRTKTSLQNHIWRRVRGVGDVTLEITPAGRAAINW